MRIILITGISGSGKSVALNVLEDAGYYCVDNLPAQFIPDLTAYLADQGYSHLGVATDIRSRESLARLPDTVRELSAHHQVQVLFLTANTDALVQRYSETRRRHPLSTRVGGSPNGPNGPNGRGVPSGVPEGEPGDAGATVSTSLIEAIEMERELLSPLSESAHRIDTSNVRTNTLRSWVKELIRNDNADGQTLTLLFESFGFKHGVPSDADMVFDVRSLPNPYYDLALRPLTGRDAPVVDFLQSQPMVLAMAEDIRAYVEKWLPSFIADNRSYLTVAIGCTGGQHRSVFIAERLANYFRAHGNVLVRHRELAPAG
ncbi:MULTISPECIES: RNase adapter RapZ [unclassified Cupriavidus]|jgi:RNase adapter protein RapZ|uniref:RNase adapter RapZ n=1 Tax=unclassified Cupriavidus TaxID=2640874 RepID=UPI001C004EE8|nr:MULTISPECIES: RNase adapter RapZ [unclassified Cupriavidus]MCA3183086.1 RNase adapter RapZ [Cupriavidus sp.]MCA3190396.1 RNase adapter RapZ [Cupriavidus sp.]MCA3197100.1 RNase adapter RapZ [Cupriavidus sp.]MCA3202377.1 RNase adapter RapZ [Cupriavidus sp.]MCA3205845.1 RNase adapter RapZ [Cupriavidus sp.]